MELSKDLKEKIEKAASAEEAMKILEEAGVELTDAEMDQVAGGGIQIPEYVPWVTQGQVP